MSERPIPRLALRAEEAAAALGVSIDHFSRHIRPQLRCVIVGRTRLYRVAELERWLADHELEGGRRAARAA